MIFFLWGTLFHSYKNENSSKFLFFHDPLDWRLEAMPKFLIALCVCGIFATVTVLRGTRWVP